MPITRLNDFRAATGKSDDLRAFLGAVIAFIKDAPGCEDCELLIDAGDEHHFVVVEGWESVEAHQAAVSRIPAAMLGEVRPLLAEPASGRYYKRA